MIAAIQGPSAWGGFLSSIAVAFLAALGAVLVIVLVIYGAVRGAFWLFDRRGVKEKVDPAPYRDKQ